MFVDRGKKKVETFYFFVKSPYADCGHGVRGVNQELLCCHFDGDLLCDVNL